MFTHKLDLSGFHALVHRSRPYIITQLLTHLPNPNRALDLVRYVSLFKPALVTFPKLKATHCDTISCGRCADGTNRFYFTPP